MTSSIMQRIEKFPSLVELSKFLYLQLSPKKSSLYEETF